MAGRLIPIGAILTAVLFVCFPGPTFSEELSHLLDGKTFVGNNGEKGRELDPDEYEELTFHNGYLRSISCEPYNFDSAAYSATTVGNTIHFEAVTQSPTHGQIAWQGIVDGNDVKATFVWTKERWYWDIHREYWFRGTLKE